ncbi:biotin-dependent carboxyltransferase family protein [Tomitella fengzijianii]|uniref:Biotin-dependent carboxyltransferase family protein n=1 Tax=Tomitella fengzijianii TaxID=2597660 RepID=A0A516X584_9ACTN|nr:biotin-dependent carboxyltransferase family protein [Tomitella fengzijianii]QDQ98248.1 biotin-dependent carboxyltransferase family protein [Tomitella fengzijianii]
MTGTDGAEGEGAAHDGCLEVEEPGPFTTVQDGGRPGLGALGVGRSGAADRAAMAAANRLVGNPERAAVLESTMGGPAVRARRPVMIAVTGPATVVEVDGTAVGSHCRVLLRAGQVLSVGAPPHGLRNYLAVRGGVTGVRGADGSVHGPELDSLATDVLSGLGPPALRAGDVLTAGRAAAPLPSADLIPPDRAAHTGPVRLPVVWGPRDDWFTDGARRLLVGGEWTVTPDADRVGARLHGPEGLRRARGGELAPESMVTGALQVPADGLPVLFLADHPVTGGYPVIAVVRGAALDAAAQLRPGDRVVFTAAG